MRHAIDKIHSLVQHLWAYWLTDFDTRSLLYPLSRLDDWQFDDKCDNKLDSVSNGFQW